MTLRPSRISPPSISQSIVLFPLPRRTFSNRQRMTPGNVLQYYLRHLQIMPSFQKQHLHDPRPSWRESPKNRGLSPTLYQVCPCQYGFFKENWLTFLIPESILVRAYEDRSDLLRSLIIGTPNTPYEDSPFVIDWLLDENFPQSPPKAHFISWTGGNGRVNPNLYEDGKICLSILGTWSGEKSESWNASRCSLLQALVSIQGLVLTKEVRGFD